MLFFWENPGRMLSTGGVCRGAGVLQRGLPGPRAQGWLSWAEGPGCQVGAPKREMILISTIQIT